MFLTDSEIDSIKEKSSNPIIGSIFSYLYLTHEANGEDGVCGLPARVVAARLIDNDTKGPFIVDLAIETSVPGFYVVVTDLCVLAVTGIDVETNETSISLCENRNLDQIKDIINGSLMEMPGNKNKPHLHLVKNDRTKDGV